jgi:hsp70-interacting protein
MESLLRWGIENSTPGDASQPAPQTRKDLDPAIIDAILGKSDAELMKEDLAVALDNGKDEDTRVEALDHMEMVCLSFDFILALTNRSLQLIEQIDNANSEYNPLP